MFFSESQKELDQSHLEDQKAGENNESDYKEPFNSSGKFETPQALISSKQAVIHSASPVKTNRRGATLRVLSI